MVIQFNMEAGVRDQGVNGEYHVFFSSNLNKEYRIAPKLVVSMDAFAKGLTETYLFPLLARGEYNVEDFIMPKGALPILKKYLLREVNHKSFHSNVKNRKQNRQITIDYYNSQAGSAERISNQYSSS